MVVNPLYLGCLIIKNGDADGQLAGARNTTGDVLRPALQIIKTTPGITCVSGAMLLLTHAPEYGKNGILVMGDVAVTPVPMQNSLLVEISQDSIWLPATLRRRYGLNSLGTVRSVGFAENLMYTLEKVYDKKQAKESENAEICRVAVCVALPEADPKEVVEDLQKLAKTDKTQKGIPVEYVAVPSPLLCPESGETLRRADAFLLAVPAGERVGKRLEAVLEYLHTQDCSVNGAFLAIRN